MLDVRCSITLFAPGQEGQSPSILMTFGTDVTRIACETKMDNADFDCECNIIYPTGYIRLNLVAPKKPSLDFMQCKDHTD